MSSVRTAPVSLDSISSLRRNSFAQYEGLRRIESEAHCLGFHNNPRAGGRNGKTRAIMASAPKREKDPRKRVVITGMGLVSVFGSDVDTFYDMLLEGQSGIGFIDRFDASAYSVRFAGQIHGFSANGYIDGKNDRRLDNCWRYSLVSGKMALENADLGKEKLEKVDKSRVGVLVGSAMGGLSVYSDGVEALLYKGFKKVTPYFIPYSISNMGSALLAIETGVMGPAYSISTACATANYCLHAAANHIRRGEADIMLAGGTEASILLVIVSGFIACNALSQRNDDPQAASRPWDKDRDGFVMGEGADLEKYLREQGKSEVIITGVMTNLCCETTARDAFNRGFRVFFSTDATATANEDLHDSALKNLAYGFAYLVNCQRLEDAFAVKNIA